MADAAKSDSQRASEKNEGAQPKDKVESKEKELSEEDKRLQEQLNMLVERLTEPNQQLYKNALESLRTLIRASTTSMTSVPKPLKFLRPHYDTLKKIHDGIRDLQTKQFCADIISVLGMTMSDQKRDCLSYKLVGTKEDMGSWGHEYVRHLTGEVAQEWQELAASADSALPSDTAAASGAPPRATREQLLDLAHSIVPYLMLHNAEADACDLLMEIEKLDVIVDHVDETSYQRVCLYLTSCVPYTPDPENTNLLKAALGIFRKFKKYPEALRLAVQLNDMPLITEIFTSCNDVLIQKQLAYMLGRQQIYLELPGDIPDYDDLIEIMSNSHLNNNFLALAREHFIRALLTRIEFMDPHAQAILSFETGLLNYAYLTSQDSTLDIMEPKTPEDIYKVHLEPSRITAASVDSARANLASSFVNGFVNCAFGQDKLLMEDGNKWLYKNKEHGMMSATASLGLILLWDVDGGLTQIDKYLYSNEDYIKAGALLACGVVNSGVRNECDPALALLSDYVQHNTAVMRIGSIVGLGLAYSGSNREDVLSLILPVLSDSKSSMEVVGMAGLACGMIAVGSCNGEVTSTLLQTLMEKPEADLKSTHARFVALGLALTYLGKQDAAEAILAALQVIAEPMKTMAEILVDMCAYAGTGNVLKVQRLLHICSEHFEEKDEDNNEKGKKKEDKQQSKEKSEDEAEKPKSGGSHQGLAVLGIALIAMGEEIGAEMCYRTFGHLLRYGEPVIKRAVPLALALISASNPKLQILDTLSKFSHDSDLDVSVNSILAMGIVGAGTNNARLAAMLRQLAVYYAKDPSSLFAVRIAQGLTHLGKGTLTLCPYHNDRTLMHPVAVASLLGTLVACLDVRNLILGKCHYLLFNLVGAIQPRMLVTFDTDLRPLPVHVRVGQAVDVVGQAGKPKTITGFQTHTTPVLLAYGERAELATEEYLPVTPIMEGFVILKKNPNYEQ